MRLVITNALLIGVLASSTSVHGQGPAPAVPRDLIVERFSVSKNGDALLVPVKVAEKRLLFLVDTGATVTLFDTSIRLGQPVGVFTGDGAEGKVEVNLYRPPEAKIGRISLGTLEEVAGMDLDSMRQALGHDVQGLLGMDFLGKHVVHIDTEKGEFLLLKAAPKNSGVEVPILWEPGDFPFVEAELAPGERTRFVIDTGFIAFNSGSIGVAEARSLLTAARAREVGNFRTVSVTGTDYRRLLQADALRFRGFILPSPVFRESHALMPNTLGLGFWSRFTATFDFPRRRVYLSKSARFSQRDPWNATGLHLRKRGDLVEVAAVDSGSRALQAGLKEGDILVELDGRGTAKTSLFELRSALCGGGQLTCVVRRDSGDLRLSIGLGQPTDRR